MLFDGNILIDWFLETVSWKSDVYNFNWL